MGLSGCALVQGFSFGIEGTLSTAIGERVLPFSASAFIRLPQRTSSALPRSRCKIGSHPLSRCRQHSSSRSGGTMRGRALRTRIRHCKTRSEERSKNREKERVKRAVGFTRSWGTCRTAGAKVLPRVSSFAFPLHDSSSLPPAIDNHPEWIALLSLKQKSVTAFLPPGIFRTATSTRTEALGR